MRTRFRKSWLWLALLGLGAGAALGLALRKAPDDRADPAVPAASSATLADAPEPAASPPQGAPDPAARADALAPSPLDQSRGGELPWLTSFEAAAALARGTGRVILAYLGTDPRHCPPCALMDRQLFQGPEARRLLEHAVPYKVRLDTPDLPAEDRERVGAWGVKVLPALLILTPERGVLHRQHAGLYPGYSMEAEPIDRLAHELSLFELVGLLEAARERAQREQERLAALERTSDRASLLERGRLLASQERWPEAIDALEASLLRDPDPGVEEELASLYHRSGAWGRAVVLLRGLVAREPGTADAARRELRLVCIERQHLGSDLDSAERRAELRGRARRLLEYYEAQGLRDDAAKARLVLAEVLLDEGRQEEAAPELERLERYASEQPGGRISASWLWRLAQLERQRGELQTAHDLARRIYVEYPTSTEAQMLKHGVLDQLRREAEDRGTRERPY